MRVVSVTDDRIELATTSKTVADGGWRKDGLAGLDWPGGYARVGRIIELEKHHVVREFVPMWDKPAPGTLVRFDPFAYPSDPRRALGRDVQDVSIQSALGSMPAWLVPGSQKTWVIGIHGKASDRGETLRLFSVTAAAGFPSLAITYRNDKGAPPAPNGRYDYGRTEWQDVDAAVSYARANGAIKVVLVGYSMGGALALSFMEHSDQAAVVSGLILDSPLLDFSAAVDYAGRRMHAPGILTDLTKTIASYRFDLDWSQLDYLPVAKSPKVPLLLFHGDRDPVLPVAVSDRLAKERPDIVTYVRTKGAEHVLSWNMDPRTYDSAVSAFLTRLSP